MRATLRTLPLLSLMVACPILAANGQEPLDVRDAPIGQRQPVALSASTVSPLVLGPGNHVLYPTSANVQGIGAYFRTKLTIFNTTGTGYDIRAGFSTTAGEVSAKLIHIGPFQSITSDNFVLDVFGLTGGGAIDLDSRYDGRTDHDFLTNATVYVDIGGGGRYSMAIQPADFTGFAGPSNPVILVGVSVNSTTRTNIGCASNYSGTQHLTAQAFNADGSAASAATGFDMVGYGWGQVAITGTFNSGTIVISTNAPAGAACYGTEINNATGDATFYLGIPY